MAHKGVVPVRDDRESPGDYYIREVRGRRPSESARMHHVRLASFDMTGLRPDEMNRLLADLRRAAQEAALEEAVGAPPAFPAPAREAPRPPLGVLEAAGAGDTSPRPVYQIETPLERARRAVGVLSPADRERLLLWVARGMPPVG